MLVATTVIYARIIWKSYIVSEISAFNNEIYNINCNTSNIYRTLCFMIIHKQPQIWISNIDFLINDDIVNDIQCTLQHPFIS